MVVRTFIEALRFLNGAARFFWGIAVLKTSTQKTKNNTRIVEPERELNCGPEGIVKFRRGYAVVSCC